MTGVSFAARFATVASATPRNPSTGVSWWVAAVTVTRWPSTSPVTDSSDTVSAPSSTSGYALRSIAGGLVMRASNEASDWTGAPGSQGCKVISSPVTPTDMTSGSSPSSLEAVSIIVAAARSFSTMRALRRAGPSGLGPTTSGRYSPNCLSFR